MPAMGGNGFCPVVRRQNKLPPDRLSLMSQNKAPSSASVGTRLRAALTDEQIQTLLDVVAEAGHLQAVDDRLRSADPNLADTVGRILFEPGTQSGAVASSQKTLEMWNELWAVWTDHVAEVSDEEGPYANQEEHWHPPYFDHWALAEDLEQAAGPLSEWIDRAFPLVNEPDVFLESLAEIDQNVLSLPDWFQPVDDNFVLGPRASSCLLRWTWLGLACQPGPGQRLVDLLCGLELPGQHSELDRDACFQFLAELPESVCHEIHVNPPPRTPAPRIPFRSPRPAPLLARVTQKLSCCKSPRLSTSSSPLGVEQ